MVTIKVITGSSRPERFNIQPAEWIQAIASMNKDVDSELLDLAEIKLPFLDEPSAPARRTYTKEHTKRWSAQIEGADGFIFVTPEYNYSYSPLLKNAIDYLYEEWSHKPVAFVSYGGVSGGVRAVEHLRDVAGAVRMFDLRQQIVIPNIQDNMDAEGRYLFTDRQHEAGVRMVEDLAFWAERLKPIREELRTKKA